MKIQMVGVNNPLLGEDGWSKLRRILSQANLSLTSFGPARDAMVGHYLGVDPGREDDWKSPARREDLKTRPSILCVTQKRAFMPLYIVLGQ